MATTQHKVRTADTKVHDQIMEERAEQEEQAARTREEREAQAAREKNQLLQAARVARVANQVAGPQTVNDSFPGATQPLALDFIEVLQGNNPAELVAAAQPLPGANQVIAAGAQAVLPDSERKVKAADTESSIPEGSRTVVMNAEHKASIEAIDARAKEGRENDAERYDR